MDLVALLEEEFCEIGSVLTGDACDQGSLQRGTRLMARAGGPSAVVCGRPPRRVLTDTRRPAWEGTVNCPRADRARSFDDSLSPDGPRASFVGPALGSSVDTAAATRPIQAFRARAMEQRRASRELAAWYRDGRPAPPPPAAKQRIVADHAKRFRCQCLVETGTYRGDMVEAQKRRFRRIFTIELDARLYERAVARFRADRHVVVLHGDSGRLLPEVIRAWRARRCSGLTVITPAA